jgi:hypothetical protein
LDVWLLVLNRVDIKRALEDLKVILILYFNLLAGLAASPCEL